MIKVTELKARKSRLGAILTATNDQCGIPIETQLETVSKWQESASKTILFTTQQPKNQNGLRVIKSKTEDTPVATLLRHYVVQIPGMEIFGLAAPNILIGSEQTEFFAHVEKQKMERAWACYAFAGTLEAPSLFIISAPVLPHILRDFPPHLTFANNEWANWLHNWMKRFMLQHRYFDATHLGIAQPVEQPIRSLAADDPNNFSERANQEIRDALFKLSGVKFIPEPDAIKPPVQSAPSEPPETMARPPFVEPLSLVSPMNALKRKPGRPPKIKAALI